MIAFLRPTWIAFRTWLSGFATPRNTDLAKSKRPRNRGYEVEEMGRWYFRRDILEKLDDYMVFIRRMKRTDPEGYRLYSRIGATVIPSRTKIAVDLEPRWKNPKRRPLFGAVAFLTVPEDDDWCGAKFAYFRRLDRPPVWVEPTNGQVYQVTLFYNRLDDSQLKASTGFYVSVSDRGIVSALRYLTEHVQTIEHRDVSARKTGRHRTRLRARQWTYGQPLETAKTVRNETPQQRAAIYFGFLANGYDFAASSVRVAVRKNGLTAAFGIDILRMPYFFRDREPTYSESGNRRRIFHIVRTHDRVGADGKPGSVRSHFRGERHFAWNGYDVLISVPGTHHCDLLDMGFGAHVYDDDEPVPVVDSIDERRLVRILDGHLRKEEDAA